MLTQGSLPMTDAMRAYCQGFKHITEKWPSFPLAESPELEWWQMLISHQDHGVTQGRHFLFALSQALPQLQLPQRDGISESDIYRRTVMRGEAIDAFTFASAGQIPQWEQPDALTLTIANHPCGSIPVIQTPNWNDFVQLVRALAHRGEPMQVAAGVHAQAISGLIHWGLIKQFGRQTRARLILLHEAPYGSVPACEVPGCMSDDQWLSASTTLRLQHELTHLATKRLLGEMRLNLLDELIADCMGMVEALGFFSAGLFVRCLGIGVADGRWTTYTRELCELDARQAVALVIARSLELEQKLNEKPWLLKPNHAMLRLQWLTTQRLDEPINVAPTDHP